jgi:hypothetical protein
LLSSADRHTACYITNKNKLREWWKTTTTNNKKGKKEIKREREREISLSGTDERTTRVVLYRFSPFSRQFLQTTSSSRRWDLVTSLWTYLSFHLWFSVKFFFSVFIHVF